MQINARKLKELCRKKDLTLTQLLKEAGVSKNAYYSLARKDTVLPKSVLAIADHLDVKPSVFLEDNAEEKRLKELMDEIEDISTRNRRADRDNIRHTLLLLQETPLDRLRRALIRGQRSHLHRQRG